MHKITGLIILLLTFVCSPVFAAQSFKVAVSDPEESEEGIAAIAFKKYVEDKTKGEVQIDLFFSGVLGDETETFRNVQKGTLAFAFGSWAQLVPFAKKLAILNLPYLFENQEQVIAGTTGKAGALLEQYALDAGFRIISWTYSDYRYIFNSRHPIKKMSDMKGLKFRVPQSPVYISAYKAFGGNPTPIAWSEAFTALQQGVVDGQCLDYITARATKFIDANQKYVTELHYTYQLNPLVMSERIYKKVSPDLQKIFIDAGHHVNQVVLEYLKTESQAAKNDMVSKGLTVNQLEDEEEWKKAAMEKVWPEMAPELGGKEAINAYLKAMGKQPWNPDK